MVMQKCYAGTFEVTVIYTFSKRVERKLWTLFAGPIQITVLI